MANRTLRFAIGCFVALTLPICAIAQKTAGIVQQTNFQSEGKFRRPVPLPRTALDALLSDHESSEVIQPCAAEEHIPLSHVPTSWFTASEINLRNGSPGLILRGNDPCLSGAHVNQFWVLDKLDSGYRVVFTSAVDEFQVLSKSTNGYRDLRLAFMMQAGATVEYVTFHYSGSRYKVWKRHTEHYNF